jgi:hypothetical protein
MKDCPPRYSNAIIREKKTKKRIAIYGELWNYFFGSFKNL